MKQSLLIDSSVWIDFLTKGPKYTVCKNTIEAGQIVGVPTIVLFEVCKKITTKVSAEMSLSVAAMLRQFGILGLSDEIALHAVDIGLDQGLAMADSIVLSHANHEDAMLITLDNDFRKIKGVKVL